LFANKLYGHRSFHMLLTFLSFKASLCDHFFVSTYTLCYKYWLCLSGKLLYLISNKDKGAKLKAEGAFADKYIFEITYFQSSHLGSNWLSSEKCGFLAELFLSLMVKVLQKRYPYWSTLWNVFSADKYWTENVCLKLFGMVK